MPNPKTISERWTEFDNERDREKQDIIATQIVRLEQMARRLGKIPARFSGGFSTYPRTTDLHKRHAETAEEWANHFHPNKKTKGFFMLGCAGCGKTGLAWAIARRVIERGFDAQVHNIGELLRRMKSEFGSPPSSQTDFLGDMMRSELLILDDLGAEQGTEWAKTQVYLVVDALYRKNRPIIVTTNIPSEMIEQKEKPGSPDGNNQRTVSRLNDMCVWMNFGDHSLRSEKEKG